MCWDCSFNIYKQTQISALVYNPMRSENLPMSADKAYLHFFSMDVVSITDGPSKV